MPKIVHTGGDTFIVLSNQYEEEIAPHLAREIGCSDDIISPFFIGPIDSKLALRLHRRIDAGSSRLQSFIWKDDPIDTVEVTLLRVDVFGLSQETPTATSLFDAAPRTGSSPFRVFLPVVRRFFGSQRR